MIKDLIRLSIVVFVLTACGSKTDSTVTEDYGDPFTPERKELSLIQQGEALVKKSDCNTCHHATSKIVGPSHTEVAEKYDFTEENVALLAQRIIKGSSGIWGQVMMNPHPGLSQEDAEKMAYYVLSLDGEKEPN
ncbi:MAG: c-type cytochrome [Cyclobacteriaceae bacterium]